MCEGALFRKGRNIIPELLILFRYWDILFLKERYVFYVHDGTAGGGEVGDF